MNKKNIKKGKIWKCPYCGTEEFIPDGEFGLKTNQILAVYCPVCMAKKKKRKMKLINEV